MRSLETYRCLSVTIMVFIGPFLKVAESKPKSSYPDDKACTGSSTGLHHSNVGMPWERYLSYVEKYGNCTTIQESIEIVLLNGDHIYDMSFLENIRVVNGYVLIYGNFFEILPLKNLRLIRGRSLYTPDNSTKSYSLYVSTNYKAGSNDTGLKEVHLTSLHEILNGEVLFESNNLLCYAQEINWIDILPRRTDPTFKELPDGQYKRTCEVCDSQCAFNNTRHCWGSTNDLCQRITSLDCASHCEHRCFGPGSTQCCDPQCAGGCGRDKHDCWVCRHFSDNGECIDKCPGKKTYNVKRFELEDNPNVKYIYGDVCVKECPVYMLIENEVCVPKCSEGSMPGTNRKCRKCEHNEVCLKTCINEYGYISSENVANFHGCDIVEGFLRFSKQTFDPERPDAIKDMSSLNAFENVKEISGYLIVEATHANFTSLSFLRNLRVIRGRALHRDASLLIMNTSLKELGLSSLREISRGHVMIAGNSRMESLGLVSLEKVNRGSVDITNNSRLCYADTINWTKIVIDHKAKVTLKGNANLTEFCEPNGFVCSNQCSSSDGCWGQTPDDCRFCAHYRFGQTCVGSCNFQKGLYPETINETKECRRCHEQCRDDCTDKGPDKCLACKNVKDGIYCLDKCPSMKFVNAIGTCEQCYEHCKGDCSGNETYLGPGGCNDCHLVKDLDNGKNICLAEGLVCPSNFYRDSFSPIDSTLTRNASRSVDRCIPCNSECHRCQSFGTSRNKNGCECIHFVHDGHCVLRCPAAHYEDVNRHCAKCHHECTICHGPTTGECSMCKNFRLYEKEQGSPVDYNEFANHSMSSDRSFHVPTTSAGDEMFVDNNQNLTDDSWDILKERFNCTDMCPDYLSDRKTITVDDHLQSVCMEKPMTAKGIIEERKGITITILVIIGVITLAVVAIIVVSLRRQWAKSEENKLRIVARMEGLDIEEIITPTGVKPDVSVLRLIKESELRRGNSIGSGAFGTVFKGIWFPAGENVKIPVAIKVLTESANSSVNVELLEEARIMASVNHPCCIRILAVCMTAQMMLVTQLMPHGSLLDYLRKTKTNIGSNALLKWSTQIARGMKYLEERGIVHRDLAARNVLVQGPGQVRITDFGLAKLLSYNEEEYLATEGKMPIKWLALESIRQSIFTHRSDVWSYGVTLWELFTYGDRPYEGIRAVDMSHHLEMGERLSQPTICTIDVYMIMIKCWMVDANSRPTFGELEMEFTNMTKDPGRYLVIQGDRFMRLQSCVEDATSPTDWLRVLSLNEEEEEGGGGAGGPEKLITADEYLRPQDLEDLHPLGSRHLPNVSSVGEENGCKRLLSIDPRSPGSPIEAFESIEAKKGNDSKHGIHRTSDPSRGDERSGNGARITTTPDIRPSKISGSAEMESVQLTDESDYIQPRSSAFMANCPNYLDVIDDSVVPGFESPTYVIGNPEYFFHNDSSPNSLEGDSSMLKVLRDPIQSQRLSDNYNYLCMTETTLNNNDYNKDARICNVNNAQSFS